MDRRGDPLRESNALAQKLPRFARQERARHQALVEPRQPPYLPTDRTPLGKCDPVSLQVIDVLRSPARDAPTYLQDGAVRGGRPRGLTIDDQDIDVGEVLHGHGCKWRRSFVKGAVPEPPC